MAEGPGWVWPHWLERQCDPSSPSFVAGGELPVLVNVTARSWTAVGNLSSPGRAVVDPRGLVTPWPGRWSLDWWVGAEDRWHLPSREPAVRQRLVGGAPVVETSMRVPGGDVVQRTYAVRAAPHEGSSELLVVEVENATPVPVALAIAIRPWNQDGAATVERIGIGGSDPTAVTVDGRVAVLLPRPPNRVASSTFEDGDVAATVLGGEAGTRVSADLRCVAGLASAALVYPLPHRASLRFLLPLLPGPRLPPGRRRVPVRRRRGPAPVAATPTSVPSASQVANGWRAHADRGMRLVLPSPRLTEAVEANLCHLLVAGPGVAMASGEGRGSSLADGALLVGVLDRYGYADEAAEVLASYPARQRRDGSFAGADVGGEGAALHALAEHWRLHRDDQSIEEIEPVVAGAAEAIVRRSGGPAVTPWDARGLLAAADVLDALGEEDAASDARRAHDRVVARLAAAPDLFVDADAGPAAFEALGGLDPARTMRLAQVELAAGERRALDRLDWLLSVATSTMTWPERVHPRLGTGCAGDGHDVRVAAHLLDFVRNMVVREVDDGLALCSLVPTDWFGQQLEVHDAPTRHGLLSYAVRWHGERPALLWELVAHDGDAAVRISAPGLDPTWSSTDRRGDALLAAVPPPPDQPAPAEAGPSGTSATPVRLSSRRSEGP